MRCRETALERALGKPRVTVSDFDYAARQAPALEVPHRERIAAIRRQKSLERERATANAARRAAAHLTLARPASRRPHVVSRSAR